MFIKISPLLCVSQEVVALKEREDYEESLLQLIETNFAFLTDEFWAEEDEVSGKEEGEGDHDG